MEGLILMLDDRAPLPDMVAVVAAQIRDFCVDHVFEDAGRMSATCLAVKSLWREHLHTLVNYHLLRYREHIVRQQELQLCWRDFCYRPVATSALKQDIFLLDKYGEELHQAHECCLQHVSLSARTMLKTLEVSPLSGGTQVLSWRYQKHFYSQVCWLETDGDYESGYVDVPCGSLRLGPYASRGKAIEEAARWKKE
jgi:hypothetical protein